MVLTADGTVGDALELRNIASKGKRGGRAIPLNDELRTALSDFQAEQSPAPADGIIRSERGSSLMAGGGRWGGGLVRRLVWQARVRRRLVPVRPAQLRHQGGEEMCRNRWRPARCPAARRPQQPRDDASTTRNMVWPMARTDGSCKRRVATGQPAGVEDMLARLSGGPCGTRPAPWDR
jgi:hypothetical protein